jgi:hypothetical protein
VKKIFITVDNKGKEGNGVDHEVTLKDGVLAFVCHLDFSRNVGQDMKSDKLAWELIPVLDELESYNFKKEIPNIKANQNWFGPRILACAPKLDWSFDLETTRAIKGHVSDYYGKPVAKNQAALVWLHNQVRFKIM